MDPTLMGLLRGMFELSQDNDRLRARVAELESLGQVQLNEVQARLAVLEAETLPPGWRLVKDA